MTENPKKGLEPLKNATPPTDKSPYDEETLKAVVQKASKHIPTQVLSPKLQKAIARLSETCAPQNSQLLSRFSDLQGLTIPKLPIDTTLLNHLDSVLGCTCAQKNRTAC